MPGVDQVRNAKLDNYCEGIGYERRLQAESRANEGSYETSALNEMVRSGIHAYHNAGVELVMVEGAAKLRVHVTKKKEATTNARQKDAGDQVDDLGNPEPEDLGDDSQNPEQMDDQGDEAEAE